MMMLLACVIRVLRPNEHNDTADYVGPTGKYLT